jgi:predicted GH43/DUF377 family glycosyl hydrolase
MIAFERLGVVLAPAHEHIAKFNAGMVAVDGVVHMLYRYAEKGRMWHGKRIDWAQYEVDRAFPYVSNCISYARLALDGTLVADFDEPVISCGTGLDRLGCEDPRIVPFEGGYYIFYCAYDGMMARTGVAYTDDFVNYVKLGVVPNPYPDKDAFIFPRRIDGKVAFVHRVPPAIQIDFFDSIGAIFLPESWDGYGERLEHSNVIHGVHHFEQIRVGGGVPPIETELGWLMLYHGVDQARHYHIGAALLDLEDPHRIVARLPYPLLSPAAPYETIGDYSGCVFPQGHYLEGGELFVSYGAADRCTAIAKISFTDLLEALRDHPV